MPSLGIPGASTNLWARCRTRESPRSSRSTDRGRGRYPVAGKVRLDAASTPGQGPFLRHRPSPRGVLCGIGLPKRTPMRHRFRKKRPCRLRMRQPEWPKAASIKEEVAICSPGKASGGAFLGQKTAACQPHESRKSDRKCSVFAGILLVLWLPSRSRNAKRATLRSPFLLRRLPGLHVGSGGKPQAAVNCLRRWRCGIWIALAPQQVVGCNLGPASGSIQPIAPLAIPGWIGPTE